MIGSPTRLPAAQVQTPTLEITPSSPILGPQSPPLHAVQPRSYSLAQPVAPHVSPTPGKPFVIPNSNQSVRPLMLKGNSEVPEKRLTQPILANILPKSECRPPVAQSLKGESQPKSLPRTPTPDALPESETSLKMSRIPLKMSTRELGVTDADLRQPIHQQPAKQSPPPASRDPQNDKVLEQGFARVRVTETDPAHNSPAERAPQSPQQKAANRRAIYKARSNPPTPGRSDTVPPGLGLPLTPPPSLTSIPVLPNQTSMTSLQSSSSSKKRSKKAHATHVPHSTPMPNLDHVPLEIVDLEAMEDKQEAFLRLAGIYKQQKFLREAEEDFHRQTIADLTAGLMAQKMENLKLLQLLQQKGITMPEIQSVVGITPDATPLARDASADTLVLEEGPNLDAARFAMLKKEEQLGLMRQFSSSQGSIPTLEADTSRRSGLSNEANSAFELMQQVKASGSTTILTPAPSMPLPPVPHSRRNSHSMAVSSSTPVFTPSARSRSLTDGNISSVPYLDSFIIEHNMRRLERDCNKSIRRRESDSTESFTSTPEFLEILFGYNGLNGSDENNDAQMMSAGQFSLVVEDVGDMATLDTTTDDVPAPEDISNSGLCISSGLTSSFSTFHTHSSNDADVSAFSSTNGSPDPNPETDGGAEDDGVAHLDGTPPMGPFDSVHTRRTIYTDVPSIKTSTATPSPRPASVDDVTWGALFMGLMRRADSRARTSSDGDLERGESVSIKSAKV
jgi:hypothetical protein